MGHHGQCLLPQAAEDRNSRVRHWLARACPGSTASLEGLGWGWPACESGARSLNFQDEVVTLQYHVLGYVDLADSALHG